MEILNKLQELFDSIVGFKIPLWLILIGFVAVRVVQNLDSLDKLKAMVLIPIARKLHILRIEKAAIKYDLQGKIQSSFGQISKELPKENNKYKH